MMISSIFKYTVSQIGCFLVSAAQFGWGDALFSAPFHFLRPLVPKIFDSYFSDDYHEEQKKSLDFEYASSSMKDAVNDMLIIGATNDIFLLIGQFEKANNFYLAAVDKFALKNVLIGILYSLYNKGDVLDFNRIYRDLVVGGFRSILISHSITFLSDYIIDCDADPENFSWLAFAAGGVVGEALLYGFRKITEKASQALNDDIHNALDVIYSSRKLVN